MEVTKNTTLITFLRDTADSIENENIKDIDLRSVGEFYMKHCFLRETNLDDEGTSRQIGNTEEFDMKDLIKFLALGWYIYSVLLQDTKENQNFYNYNYK